VLLLIVGERLGRFPQIDLALHDAVRRPLAAVVTAVNQAAPIDEIALARGHGRKEKPGLVFQKSRNAPRSSAMYDRATRRGPDATFRRKSATAHRGDQPGGSSNPLPCAGTDFGHAQHRRANLLCSSWARMRCAVQDRHADRLRPPIPRIASTAFGRTPACTSRPWVIGAFAPASARRAALQHGLGPFAKSFPAFPAAAAAAQPGGPLREPAIDFLQRRWASRNSRVRSVMACCAAPSPPVRATSRPAPPRPGPRPRRTCGGGRLLGWRMPSISCDHRIVRCALVFWSTS
jgi:hypothetical protein